MSSDIVLPDGRKLSSLKVVELKKELETFGLSQSGAKKELSARLHEALISVNKQNEPSVEPKSSVAAEIQDNILDQSADTLELTAPDSDEENADTSINTVIFVPKGNSEPIVAEANGSPEITDKKASNDDSQKSSRSGNSRHSSSDSRTSRSMHRDVEPRKEETSKHATSRRRQWGSTGSGNKVPNISSDSLEKLVPTLTVSGIRSQDSQAKSDVPPLISEETPPATKSNQQDLSTVPKGLDSGEVCAEREVELEVEAIVENMDAEDASMVVDKPVPVEGTLVPDSESSKTSTHKSTEHRRGRPSPNHAEKTNNMDAKSSPSESSKVSAKKHSPSKRKGPKETKAVGYLVEQPERIEPCQTAKHRPTDIVYIRSLVRPFTAEQLKQMISTRFGKVIDLWLDRIKSTSVVRLNSVETATSCREGLDGCRWPSMNPRVLRCDFGNDELFAWMKEHGDSSNPQPPKHLVLGEKPPTPVEPPVDSSKPKRTTSDLPTNREGKSEDLRKKLEHGSRDGKSSRSTLSEAKEPIVPEEQRKPEEPAKLLDDLFKKTTTTPCIYWLPLTSEQAEKQAAERAQANAIKRTAVGYLPRSSDNVGTTQRATRSPFAGPTTLPVNPSNEKSSAGTLVKMNREDEQRASRKPMEQSKPVSLKNKSPEGMEAIERRENPIGDKKTKSRPEVASHSEKQTSSEPKRRSSNGKVDALVAEKRKREQSPFTPSRNSTTRESDKAVNLERARHTAPSQTITNSKRTQSPNAAAKRPRLGRTTRSKRSSSSSSSCSSAERRPRPRADGNERGRMKTFSRRSRSRSFHRRGSSPVGGRSSHRSRR